MIKEIDTEGLYELTVRLLSEDPIKNREIKSPMPIFFHALPDDEGLFTLAHEAFVLKKTDQIILNGSNGEKIGDSTPKGAWDGFEIYRDKLMALGVPEDNIISAEPAYHSKEENDKFLNIAIEKGWKSGILLCHPYRALRFMLGMVESMKREDYWMNIWILTSSNLSWQKVVIGSQGIKELARKNQIYEELIRIPKYIKKGDLISLEELIKYLDKRDNKEIN